jgi:hypothetical protein
LATITYSDTTVGGTYNAIVTGSEVTNATHTTFLILEGCATPAGSTNCGAAKTVNLFLKGFKNERFIIPTYAQFFIVESMDPTKTYLGDVSTASIIATLGLTEATITNIAIAYAANTAANFGAVTFSLDFGSSLIATDYLNLAFSTPFFMLPGTTATTCT